MRIFLLVALVVGMFAGGARADFAADVRLGELESLSIQHQQTLKTLDSFARQVLFQISGKSAWDGRPALYTVLDIASRPDKYRSANVIKIKNVPLRQDLQVLEDLPAEERERILKTGLVSWSFLMRPDVQALFQRVQSSAAYKNDAINQVFIAFQMLEELMGGDLQMFKVIPPGTTAAEDHVWRSMRDVVGNVPEWAEQVKSMGIAVPTPAKGYEGKEARVIEAATALKLLQQSWREENAQAVNAQIVKLATVLPAITPERYPSALKRKAEVVYNRLAKLTIPGAAFYFTAFVLLLAGSRAGLNGLRLWGLRFLAIGLIVHTAGIGIRWWLVTKSVGNWFESIPIKNQFESVLFSAWFGCLVGFILELWRSRGIFGAAASFVGWLSLVAIFATPYVTGREIGGEIGQAAGVLMSYWLYIHVTMVVASYALIGMGFLLSVWWLIKYYMEYGTVSKASAYQISGDTVRYDDIAPAGAAVALTFGGTLARMLFMKRETAPAGGSNPNRSGADEPRRFLATLDLCNLVILQLAFWLLGTGIILGAVWADMSWGRPWGWDPKETFALVTWIVYLVVVHVRVATADKAWWTAVLSIIGFFIMLFNWIGVNFFLVGLHSYA